MKREDIVQIVNDGMVKYQIGEGWKTEFDNYKNALKYMAGEILDFEFPCSDTMFIRFTSKVNPIQMAYLMSAFKPDEASRANADDLKYLHGGVIGDKCRRNITKYMRFWWD